MATAAAEGSDRRVSIARVFSRAFGTIGSNPVTTLGIGFLFGALPSLLAAYAVQQIRAESFVGLGAAATIAIGLFSLLVSILLGIVAQGVLVRVTVAFSEGRKASLAESAMAGLRVALPLFLLGVLNAIGLALGFLLLIVPGVILYLMWSVAAPALVEERLGPIEALGRSRYLTRGARWQIFGLTLVVLIVYWMASGLVAAFTIASYGGIAEVAASAAEGPSFGQLAINAVVATVYSAVSGVIQPSLYVELRDWKDGPRTEALAEIFG
ncbi:MAG TPA: hypothetical protein VF574_01895 [Allosphingosinicella sp.]|jgi:uncharacterized membrane protein